MGLDVMNECIDSTMGRIPRMLAELLASDDPRTSWSFQSSWSESSPLNAALHLKWLHFKEIMFVDAAR